GLIRGETPFHCTGDGAPGTVHAGRVHTARDPSRSRPEAPLQVRGAAPGYGDRGGLAALAHRQQVGAVGKGADGPHVGQVHDVAPVAAEEAVRGQGLLQLAQRLPRQVLGLPRVDHDLVLLGGDVDHLVHRDGDGGVLEDPEDPAGFRDAAAASRAVPGPAARTAGTRTAAAPTAGTTARTAAACTSATLAPGASGG